MREIGLLAFGDQLTKNNQPHQNKNFADVCTNPARFERDLLRQYLDFGKFCDILTAQIQRIGCKGVRSDYFNDSTNIDSSSRRSFYEFLSLIITSGPCGKLHAVHGPRHIAATDGLSTAVETNISFSLV